MFKRFTNWFAGEIIPIIYFFACVGLIAYLLSWGITIESTKAQCLRLGWFDAKVSYRLEQYCARGENGLEVVRPLEDIILEGIVIEY